MFLVVMAYRPLPIQQHEITVSDELVDEVLGGHGGGELRPTLWANLPWSN
jgi:hypothetical protein